MNPFDLILALSVPFSILMAFFFDSLDVSCGSGWLGRWIIKAAQIVFYEATRPIDEELIELQKAQS